MDKQESNRPIFIVCSPRSGSTLLRLILNSHSRIAIPPPTFLFNYIYPFLFSYGDITSDKNLHLLIEDVLDLQIKCKPWPIAITVEAIMSSLKERSFTGLYSAIHEIYAQHYGKQRWGEKTPRDIFYIKEILECYPNAQFIHIIRDGRDVAVDWIEHLDWPKNLYGTANAWKTFINAVKPWRGKLKSDQLLEVQYEDLIKDPSDVVQNICNYIGEEYESGMLEYYKSDEALKWSKTANCHRFSTMPLTKEFVGIYKKKLSKEKQEMLSSAINQELKELGYQVEENSKEITERELKIYIDEENITEVSAMVWKIDYFNKIEKRRQEGIWSD
jgi:hypothetical protein